MNKSCVAACLESVRMAVESVSGCSWNECPDQRGITVRMCVEWVSESAWNPQIACTRSFGGRKHTLQELQEAVAGYATRAGEKLRGQRHLCQAIQVFIRSSPFDQRGEAYSRTTCVALPYPSADTRDLVAASLAGLQAIFRPGPAYAKAGVILMDFVEPGRFTPDLFAPAPRPGSDRLMAVIDTINAKQGRGTIRPARLAPDQGFSMKRERLSPRFTTAWAELLRVKC